MHRAKALLDDVERYKRLKKRYEAPRLHRRYLLLIITSLYKSVICTLAEYTVQTETIIIFKTGAT